MRTCKYFDVGLWARIRTIFGAKANKALDKMEDPRDTLDLSYEKQLEQLQKVRRGVADVATARKRIELQRLGARERTTRHYLLISERAQQPALGIGDAVKITNMVALADHANARHIVTQNEKLSLDEQP